MDEMRDRAPGAAIRRASRADIPGVLKCLADAFAPYRNQYSLAGYLDTVLTAETIERRLREMTILVAEEPGDGVIGTIAFGVTKPGEGHVRGMAVLPGHEGRGVAGRLLRIAEHELSSLGCARVTLDTTKPLERAIAFYTRAGYEPTGVVTDFFGMPLIEYAKPL